MYGTRSLLLKTALVLAVLAAAVLFVRMRKEALVREGAGFLQNLLSRETKLDVHIGKISGKIMGVIRFDDVRLEDPGLPAGLRTFFKARRIEFRYRPWEFLTKNFRAKIVVNVLDPELHWRPTVRVRADPFPFFNWLRDLLLTQRQRIAVHVKNLKLVAGLDRVEFDGIKLDYEDDRFEADIPVRHLELGANDLNTEIHLRARLEWGLLKTDDKLVGQVTTQGSVVNWQPLPWESRVDFMLTRERLELDTATLLGGFEVTGEVRFAPDAAATLRIRANNYALRNFEPFFGHGNTGSYDGTLDLEARLEGPLDALRTQADAMISGGRIGSGRYRAMVLHATGVYPTLTLSGSHLLLEDGTQMKFADKPVEFQELLSSRTYRGLVADAAQDNVKFGGWGFKRPYDENQKPEFLMERSLGDRARVQFRKYNETETDLKILEPDEEERRELEVGFQYRLLGDDTLKYTVREDEQFVGIERKMSF